MEDKVAAEAMGHIKISVEDHHWSLEDLSIIWRTVLTRRKSHTLIRGFQLFIKVIYVCMYTQERTHTCTHECIHTLQIFQNLSVST